MSDYFVTLSLCWGSIWNLAATRFSFFGLPYPHPTTIGALQIVFCHVIIHYFCTRGTSHDWVSTIFILALLAFGSITNLNYAYGYEVKP